MKQYLIDEATVKALIAYLETKPYKESATPIAVLSRLESIDGTEE